MSLTIKFNPTTNKYDLIQRVEGLNIDIEVDSAPNGSQANQLYWQHLNYYQASGKRWDAILKVQALTALQGLPKLEAPAEDKPDNTPDLGNNDEE